MSDYLDYDEDPSYGTTLAECRRCGRESKVARTRAGVASHCEACKELGEAPPACPSCGKKLHGYRETLRVGGGLVKDTYYYECDGCDTAYPMEAVRVMRLGELTLTYLHGSTAEYLLADIKRAAAMLGLKRLGGGK